MPALDESISHDTTSPPTTTHDGLMSDGASDGVSASDGLSSEKVKTFVFTSYRTAQDGTQSEESLEIRILELLEASYSFYIWPCAPVLALFLWEHRDDLVGKHVLELGAGTSLPGILASKCGASVTLSDSANNTRALQHIRRCTELNGVQNQVRIIGITWGLFLNSLFTLGPLDLIIGSDCFYEPTVFEDIVVIVAFLLEKNPHARFLCTYQERSADWSIEHFLNKWGLTCTHVPLDDLGAKSNVSVDELMQAHTIHLLDIRRRS
ncbi:methyltransferase-like protein 23 [Odontomachus brunneus]|uniref:methyltransferase-like protein 23 n=1 Tax=Odontomachus brunneus TaxID=486640 RepID=UPI0013F1B4E6|nr:methyltransferase-like protein 23 [Odontomachus brunneus]